jgi:hypothetical protein
LEEACRKLGPKWRVDRPTLQLATKRETGGSPITAEPDYVIELDGKTQITLDAKYTRSAEVAPAAEHVYQVTAAARAASVPVAAILRPAFDSNLQGRQHVWDLKGAGSPAELHVYFLRPSTIDSRTEHATEVGLLAGWLSKTVAGASNS